MVVVKIVGTVVKLVGSGIGLGREAYLHHKEKQEARKELEEHGHEDGVAALSDSMSRTHVSPDDHDIYIQLPEEHAHDLIAKGHAVAATEEEKRDLKHIDDDDDDDDDDSSIEHVERDWELDEQAGLPPPYEEYGNSDDSRMEEQQAGPAVPTNEQQEQEQQQNKSSVAKLVDSVVASARPTTEGYPLPFPVIIPQRRPGSKSRGFVRGYAPDLAASGISQETFLLFLNNLDLAAQASPALRAIFVSAGIVGLVPGTITFAVSLSVQILVGAAMEVESRYKANAYLDQLNKELFMPRGLYAMVMRYKPGTAVPSGQTEYGIEDINIETVKNVARRAPGVSPDAERHTGTKILKQLRVSSGVTKGEATMPTRCATLIFPTPDGGAKGDPLLLQQTASSSTGNASTTQPGEESAKQQRSFHDKIKSARAFVEDYLDRRTQAEYIAKNPNSTLAKQTNPPQFRSRYADPNNSTNNHLFDLLTGGHAHAQTLGADRRVSRKQWRNERRMARGLAPRDGPAGPVGLVLKGVKKVLKEDVFYLMVVNLPSQEELEEAKRVLLEHGWMKRIDDLKKSH
jgi:hypothetical protein